MKLDVDCVRDVLLEFENFPIGCYTPYNFLVSVKKHGIDSVEYCLAKLKEADYVNADIRLMENGNYEFYGIYNLTFDGHQFLEKIRDGKIWSKTKSIAGGIGSHAFDVITKIATAVITELITGHFMA